MATEKLRLPDLVRARLRSRRISEDLNQSEVAHQMDDLDEELFGHYETGRRPVPKARLRKWVQVLGLAEQEIEAMWRLAIEDRIGELLADGRMTETDRDHILWVIHRTWPPEQELEDPQKVRTA